MRRPFRNVPLILVMILAGGCSLFDDDDGNGIPAGADQSLSMDEDDVLEFELQGMFANTAKLADYDIVITEQPAHGYLTPEFASDDETGHDYLYYPEHNYHGNDSFFFAFTRDDETGATGRVTIDIRPINDAPYISARFTTGTADTALPIAIDASDPDDSEWTWSITEEPEHGTVTVDQDGLATYHGQSDFVGYDSFRVTVADDGGLENSALFPIRLYHEVIAAYDDGTILVDTDNQATSANINDLGIAADTGHAWFSANSYDLEPDLSMYGTTAYRAIIDNATTTPSGLAQRTNEGQLQDYCQGLSCSDDGSICAYIGATISTGFSHLYVFEVADREQTLIDVRDKMPTITESTYFSSLDLSGLGDHLAFTTIGDGIDDGSHAWIYDRSAETVTMLPTTIVIDGTDVVLSSADNCAINAVGQQVVFTANYLAPSAIFSTQGVFCYDSDTATLTTIWPASEPPAEAPDNWSIASTDATTISGDGSKIAIKMEVVDAWGYTSEHSLILYGVLDDEYQIVRFGTPPAPYTFSVDTIALAADASKLAITGALRIEYTYSTTPGFCCPPLQNRTDITIIDLTDNTQTGLDATDIQAMALTPDGSQSVTVSNGFPTTFHRYDLTAPPSGAN